MPTIVRLYIQPLFLHDFAGVLEALLSTANSEALAMTASLDEFDR
jgi:hypothetical protein